MLQVKCTTTLTIHALPGHTLRQLKMSINSTAIGPDQAWAAQTGTIISLLLSPFIISELSWEAIFYIFGATGFFWLLLWLPLVKDDAYNPASAEFADGIRTFQFARASTARVRSYLEDAFASSPASGSDASSKRLDAPSRRLGVPGAQQKPNGTTALAARQQPAAAGVRKKPFDIREVPWSTVLRNKPFWGIFISHAAWGFGHYACLSWLPTYYYHEYGLNVRDSALVSALPWVVTVGVTNFGGWAADQVVTRGILTRVQVRTPPCVL